MNNLDLAVYFFFQIAVILLACRVVGIIAARFGQPQVVEMCITAFPMLARIIHYKKLAGTLMGTVAIGAGAIDDAVAWCLLAVVLASFDDNPLRAVGSIGGGVGFVTVDGRLAVAIIFYLLWPQHAD